MFDLLLTGGTVVDPSQDLHGRYDIAIQDGRIAALAPSLQGQPAKQIVDLSGRYAMPGLIDLHAHVYHGVTAQGVHPDIAGVYAGVATVVDAGSSGSATFGGFPKHILPNCTTEVLPFLHIGQTGLATNPDIFSESSVNLDATLRVIEEHRGLIRGIKARMVSPALEIMGMAMPRLAKQASKQSGLPLMVHIGDTEKRCDPSVIRELLPMLERGDIVTHLFTANTGGVLDANGHLVPEARDLVDRGVWLDTAHGRFNFSFDVARRVLDQGLVPHTISTDLTIPGRQQTVHSLVEMLGRFMGLGFSLDQVIAMCTANAARVLGEQDRLGSLAVGRQADISVLEVHEDGDWRVFDSLRESLRITTAVIPALTFKRGQMFTPEWGPHPWGWLPPPADAA